MEIKIEEMNGKTVAKLNGRLDTIGAEKLENTLDDLVNKGHSKLVIDFKEVKFLSSAGLRVLLKTGHKVNALNGRLTLKNMSEEVRLVIDIAGNLSLLLDIE